MKKLVLVGVVILCLLYVDVKAQQEAMISQFVMNAMTINPGYVGYREIQSINFTHRSQWIGFEGAPSTDVITFDMPFEHHRRIAIGGSLMHDQIGPTKELGLSGTFAYRLQLADKQILSMGLQGYTGLIQADFSSLIIGSHLYDQVIEDNSLINNPDNVFVPNVGFGAYYHTPNSFIGLSAPRLIRSTIQDNAVSNIISQSGRTKPTYFLMAGRNFKMSEAYDIQPALLIKSTVGAPLSAGLSANLLYGDVMKVGVFYNYKEVLGAMFQYRVSVRTRLGYSFDMSTHRLAQTNLGSHEVSAAYVFRDLRRKIVYPRKF